MLTFSYAVRVADHASAGLPVLFFPGTLFGYPVTVLISTTSRPSAPSGGLETIPSRDPFQPQPQPSQRKVRRLY